MQIELFQGSEIVDELLYYRTIRNEFFPGAGIDVVELKRLAMRTAELTPEELENLRNQLQQELETELRSAMEPAT